MADGHRAVTLGELIAQARDSLAQAEIEDAALDARLLVEHFTGTTRADAVSSPQRVIESALADNVRQAIGRRAKGEPVHRIIGFREFYGLELRLSKETLEPRPDTETLVDLALPYARRFAGNGDCRILDLGTGTGAIALALLVNVPAAHAIGGDISADALATAKANANIHEVSGRFEPVLSDWFRNIQGRFHMIVSNPPYIATAIWTGLDREVRDFDPRAALDGGPDGLNAYRIIARKSGSHLYDNGVICVEIGYDQRTAVGEIFAAENYAEIAFARDLAGHDRALIFALAEGVGIP